MTVDRTRQVSVLVVDDNEDAAEMLHTLLASCDHDVLVAHSGEQALERAGDFAPVAGLLDIGMPGMSGYELAAALRSDPRTAAMFLVAITGWAFVSWDWVAGLMWFLGKSYAFVFLFVWMRGTLPRVRIDQLMGFAWKWLLPASLLNLFVTAAALVVVHK